MIYCCQAKPGLTCVCWIAHDVRSHRFLCIVHPWIVNVIRSYVALGDSFTEGLNDPYRPGEFRGWADRLAEHIAAEQPGLGYANLAVRGKLLQQVVDDQVPVAAAMRPDLISFSAGGNDMLRPGA